MIGVMPTVNDDNEDDNSNGLEWSPGCTVSDASGLLSSVFLWP